MLLGSIMVCLSHKISDTLYWGYGKYKSQAAAQSIGSYSHSAAARPTASSAFKCDGRTHCSQMTSCAEATYFVQHCPNTQMDGNNDGVPCERQWCVN